MSLFANMMRVTTAFAALIWTAANAQAFPADDAGLCSGGFDKPARLIINGGELTLTVGNRVEKFEFHEPYEGADGFSVNPTNDAAMPEDPLSDLPRYDAIAVKIGDEEVVLFKDRVFWPCK